MRLPLTLRSTALLCLLPASASADVLVVDATGGGAHLEVAAAVAAAQDGDLIFVRPGTYSAPVVIVDRDLTIAAEGPGTVTLAAALAVRGTTADDLVVLSGLVLLRGFAIEDCAGTVHLQDCSVPPPAGTASVPNVNFTQFGDCGIGTGDQVVVNSRQVTCVACEFHGARGGSGGWDGEPGSHGLLVRSSTVALYGCLLRGGDGGRSGGGHPPVFNGAGGDGLRCVGAGSVVHYERLAASGGPGGQPFGPGYGGPGCDGIAVRTDPGDTVEPFTHPELVLDAPVLLRGTLSTPLTATGPPGALVVLVSNSLTDWRPLGTDFGILHVGGALRISPLGVIPGSGTLSVTISGSALVGVSEFVPQHYQLAGFHLGRRYLSEPRRVHLVNAGL